MSKYVEKRGTHEMKNTILSFALPLLLALSPAAASAARILWVNVLGSATVVDGGGGETSASLFQSSGLGINAFQVSVPDENAPGGVARLVFAYEDALESVVIGDETPDTRPVDFGTDGGALWAPLNLAGYTDPELVVTLAIGHVDWDAFDAGYDAADSSTWDVPFEPLAIATETLGNLLGEPNVSIRSDLNQPGQLPWTPDRFIASWTIPVIQRANGACEGIIVTPRDLDLLGLGSRSGVETISNALNAVQSNGCRMWENLVLGNSRANLLVATVPSIRDAGLGLALPATAPVSGYGYEVLYELRRGAKTAIQTAAEHSALSIPLYPADRDTSRDPTDLYRVWTLIVPESNLAITNAIPSTNAVGVLRVASSLTNTVAAVPWVALASDPLVATNVSVAAALHPANLSEGDRVLAYDDAAGVYHGWTRTGDKVDDFWEPMATATIDGMTVAPAPENWHPAPGTAFWVLREAPLDDAAPFAAKPFFLYGQYLPGSYSATISGGSASAPAGTLCANPTPTAISVASLTFEGDIGADDTIVLNADGPVSTVFVRNADNTEWGRWQKTRVGNRIRTVWVQDGSIAPGTGFWYIRRASGDLSVTWPGWTE